MKTSKAPTVSATAVRQVVRHASQLALIGVLLHAAGPFASAAPGDLDPSFGMNGQVIFDSESQWTRVVPASNGDLFVSGGAGPSVVTGRFIARFSPNGEPVTSFGTGGKVTLNLSNYPYASLDDLAILADGKVLAVAAEYYTLDSVKRTKIALVRMLSNGNLDTSFGGDGVVEIDTLQANFKWVTGLALDSSGRILISGGTSTRRSVAIVRLTPAGFLDTTFSSDGMAQHDLASETIPMAMTIQPDGNILIAGYVAGSVSDLDHNLMVCRVLADGNLDSNFGTAGKLTLDLHGGADEARAICLRPDGRIILAGVSNT